MAKTKMKNKITPMMFIRSALFNLFFFGSHFLVTPWLIFVLPFPRSVMYEGLKLNFRLFAFYERFFLGLRYEMEGTENLPEGSYIFASKHQSLWETYKLHMWLKDPAIIMKKELTRIPVWGWLAWKNQIIAVDRGGRGAAIKSLVAGGLRAKAQGRPVTIFPEGTRTAPGTHKPYKYGVAALYNAMKVPVVPVVLNSGCFWPKNAFIKHGGVIKVRILPPLPIGLDGVTMVKMLEEQMEAAAAALPREPS